MQTAHTRVAKPREDELARDAGGDHLVVDQIRRQATQGQVALALANDLVSRGESNEVREALDRDGIAVAHQLTDRVAHRRNLVVSHVLSRRHDRAFACDPLRPMRILVHDYAGHPFQAQLSRELARRGHKVWHAYRSKVGGRAGALERLPSDPDGLMFNPIVLGPRAAQRRGVLRRLRHERAYSRAAAALVDATRPDIVLSSNTPLIIQRSLLRATHRAGGRFVYWMQDRISVSQTRKLRRRFGVISAPAARALLWLERSSLVASDAVVAVAPVFTVPLLAYGVSAERVAVIANWAPLDELVPVPRGNDWAFEHDLADRLVFLYAGSLGLKHEPGALVRIAQALPHAAMVVVAEGSGAAFVAAEKSRLSLDNILVLPSQPYERLAEVLGTADVLVAILDREGGAYSVPSKVLSYLCAERAILASIPRSNLAAQVLLESGGGVVVEPGAVDDWLAAARELAGSKELRDRLARDGRDYALRTFDVAHIADEFETVFNGALLRRRL